MSDQKLVRCNSVVHVELHTCPNCGHYMTPTRTERSALGNRLVYDPKCTVELYCTNFDCGVHVTVEGRAFALYNAAMAARDRPDPTIERAAAELEEQARKCLARAAEIRRGK